MTQSKRFEIGNVPQFAVGMGVCVNDPLGRLTEGFYDTALNEANGV